jgi:LemA protein
MGLVFGLVFWILLISVVLALFSYNKLQHLAQNIKEAASNVQIAISKKLSLINQLIDVVKNHQEYEQFTHLKISQDTSAPNLMAAYQQSGTVLATLQGFIERFPNLKTTGQYHRLVDSIQQCESEIQQTRQKYNLAVKNYNSVCLSLPTVLIAGFIGFSQAPYLEFDITGLKDVTNLKEFKTGDAERIQQLLHTSGFQIAEATKSAASRAGKLIATTITGTRCGNCDQHLSADGKFCQYCGAPASIGPPIDATNRCLICGTENAPGGKFCTACGQAV